MSGAEFLRADLHVHTHADGDPDPKPDLSAYLKAANDNEIAVLAITDHNAVRFVRDGVALAGEVAVLPGIEISTRTGHLLAIFDPKRIEDLESFATKDNLRLAKISETEARSERAMIDLIEEIGARGGLAIPAHVDAKKGMVEKMDQSEMTGVLCSRHLAGLEFTTKEALEGWFTDEDTDPARRGAWKARIRDPELAERGLGRLMSSDAHSADKVGRDRASRTLTRLRLEEPSFEAIRNAVQLNPKARCKAETTLPATYPQIISAHFEGGFLDGVTLELSPNLNCLIGSRGSGKSTALLSICAALGAPAPPGEDPDDKDRMPIRTTVTFIDKAGSERIAVRERGKEPVSTEGSRIRLRLADLGQGESGSLARGYRDEPLALLGFLDGFIVKHEHNEAEEEVLSQLAENGAELVRTAGTEARIKELADQQSQQEDALQAAEKGKIESIARYAKLLSAQGPMLARVEELFTATTSTRAAGKPIDLTRLASDFSVDLSEGPAKEFVEGDNGLRARLERFEAERAKIDEGAAGEIVAAGEAVREQLTAWRTKQSELEVRLTTKSEELKAQGLEPQAGAVLAISKRVEGLKTQLVALREKETQHEAALKTRGGLLDQLRRLRDRLHETRKAKLGAIAAAANKNTEGLEIHLIFDRLGVEDPWKAWLTTHFSFREPRVSRIARLITPERFAALAQSDPDQLRKLREDGGGSPFEDCDLELGWDDVFALETMRLEDRPRIEVKRQGTPRPQPFDHLSAGQQRSVLLSLMLCAEQSDPLVLDQPEDHLDGQYIAGPVVRALEGAKERRQVLIATHSPNLVVLGDAELVVPMRVDDNRGAPYEIGAVDRPRTRDQVCALLEGGTEAYRKRGLRYGFLFSAEPNPAPGDD